MPANYAQRLIAYIDILGWRDAADRLTPETMLEAVNLIHAEAGAFNAAKRQEVLELSRKNGWQALPGFQNVRVAAFSDNIAVSMPSEYGASIFAVRRICLGLLQLGFLARGGVTIGDLYHEDNLVFGPALNRAYEIESKEAKFPRLICDESVVKLFDKQTMDHELMVDENDGKYIVDLYSPPLAKAPSDVWRQFLDNYYKFAETLKMIESKIGSLGETRKRKKWEYMKAYVEKAKKRLFELIGSDLPPEYC